MFRYAVIGTSVLLHAPAEMNLPPSSRHNCLPDSGRCFMQFAKLQSNVAVV
jgi:hypothetical protein